MASNKKGKKASSSSAPKDEADSANFTGYSPVAGTAIDRIDVQSITPQQFFEKYVSKRKPCLLIGAPTDPEWRGFLWTDDYLKKTAGKTEIEVEVRSPEGHFGLGVKVKMPFGELVDKIASGADNYYVTTQEIETDEHGYPVSLYGPPLADLRKDFPLRPAILGNLVPHQMNVWIGHNKAGTSSGLHFDYHDNLYVLVRGKKRFTMFSPEHVHRLYIEGKVAKVHPNGLINTAVLTRADGAHLTQIGAEKFNAAVELYQKLEQELDELHERKASKAEIAAAEKRLNDAEPAMEEAMAAMCDQARQGGNIPEDDDEDDEAFLGSFRDDYEEDEADFEFGDSDEEDEEEEFVIGKSMPKSKAKGAAPKAEKKANKKNKKKGAKLDRDEEEDDEDMPVALGKASKRQREDSSKDTEEEKGSTAPNPANFSKVPIELVHDMESPKNAKRIASEFPLFAEAVRLGRLQCEVNEGEMLYIPASWFHEVTSFSGPKNNGHFAFNYWCHPPDADDFKQPYADPFWERRLKGRPEQAKPSAKANSSSAAAGSSSSSSSSSSQKKQKNK